MSIFVKLLENVIMHFYNITNDYGIAIVCITVLVKVILLPLNIKQRKQMEKQSALSEQVEDIKRRCKNDNERLNKLFELNLVDKNSEHKTELTEINIPGAFIDTDGKIIFQMR